MTTGGDVSVDAVLATGTGVAYNASVAAASRLFVGGWRRPMPYLNEPTLFHLTGPEAAKDAEVLRKAIAASRIQFEDEWLLELRDLAEVL